MHFQNLFSLIWLVASTTVALAAVIQNTSPTEEKQLFSRAIPSCPELYGEVWEAPAGKQLLAEAGATLRNTGHYAKAPWRHPICDRLETICFLMAKGISWQRPPADPSRVGQDRGYWEGGDGTSVLASKYWHNELLFNASGGSAKVYPAHGFIFICVKGNIKATIIYGGHNGRGLTGSDTVFPNDRRGTTRDPDGWEGVCKCFGNQRWDIHGSDISFDWV